MQHNETMKAEALALSLDDASRLQQEAIALAEALERWLDDGGTSDDEAAYDEGTGAVSPFQFFRFSGGLL